MLRSGLLLALLLAACATAAPPAAPPPAGSPAAAAEAPAPFPDSPTLEDVLARVDSTPALAAARAAVEAREGMVEQADLPPNPVAGVRQRVEPSDLSDGMRKTTLSARQRFETAGKRDARVAAARAEAFEAQARVATERLRVATTAALAHQQARAAGAVAEARRASLAATQDLVGITRSLLDAGRLPESALPPLLAEVGRLRLGVADAERDELTALRRLEGALALPSGSIRSVTGELPIAVLPAPADATFDAHPEILALRAAEETARARIESAEALAVPDVTVGLELERSRERERTANTVGIGVEVPLPLFDRNQGAIRAAKAEATRAAAAIEDARARLQADYGATRAEIDALGANLATYLAEILPALERDLALAETTEEAGRADRTASLRAAKALAGARAAEADLAYRLASRRIAALALLGRL